MRRDSTTSAPAWLDLDESLVNMSDSRNLQENHDMITGASDDALWMERPLGAKTSAEIPQPVDGAVERVRRS
jgi:hypothetical protein